MKKKIRNAILADAAIAGVAVAAYSPGMLGLSPNDPSIFRAGCSIILPIVLIYIFYRVNSELVLGEKHEYVESVSNMKDAERVMKSYISGKYFGKTAETVLNQLYRIQKSTSRLDMMLDKKFETSSLSWQRYHGVIEDAEKTINQTICLMANRMLLFDEEEYKQLLHFKEDRIPDDIQEERLKLYRENLEKIESAITVNERILLQFDKLTSGLTLQENRNDELLEKIQKLTEEIKYYQ